MIDFIVIESGGTKSTWAFGSLTDGLINTVETVGLHPQEITPEKTTSLKLLLEELDIVPETKLYFYGAGCSENNKPLLVRFFAQFHLHHIVIRTDLEGACIASLRNNAGYTAILGTGAIAAEYDGKKVVRFTSGLGYLLGDEGSGFDLGKRLLILYYQERLAENIKLDLESYFGGKNQILSKVYDSEGRKNVAGLTRIIHAHKNNPLILSLIKESFHDFHATALKDLAAVQEISFIGSIAFYFQKELTEVLAEYSIAIKQIQPSAIHGLFEYHADSSIK